MKLTNLTIALLMVMGLAAHSQEPPALRAIAAGHVAIAEKTKGETMLWGRIAGSAAERESAGLLLRQLQPFVDNFTFEAIRFEAHRPHQWRLAIDDETVLDTAMPAPFDARFPLHTPSLPIVLVDSDDDWAKAKGKWAFIEATMQNSSPGRSSIRSNLVYQKAVAAEVAGFIFSLPTPPGRWRAVVPVDKPYSKKDTFFPNGVRPVPSFCVDAVDGKLLRDAAAAGGSLSCTIAYQAETSLDGLNVLASIEGSGDDWIALAVHLDSFFSGANDDASGMAVLVGLAHRLSVLPKASRPANFILLGLSAHHDVAAGMRSFVERNPARMAKISGVFLLEHLDAVSGSDSDPENGWPANLNNGRAAYLGSQDWPELRAALPGLVRETGLMTVSPRMVNQCIADLFVVCGDVRTFTLIQGPPFYHTDHDTMDKLTEEGLQNAVEFHLKLFEIIGAIEP